MSKFVPGQSGNPGGKMAGTLNKRTQLAKLFEPHAEDLIMKAIHLAKAGDVATLRFCLERLIPRIKNEVLTITLPEINMDKPDAVLVLGAEILKAVSNQQISPEQGKLLTDMIEAHRKNIETYQISDRISEIERVLKIKKSSGENYA